QAQTPAPTPGPAPPPIQPGDGFIYIVGHVRPSTVSSIGIGVTQRNIQVTVVSYTPPGSRGRYALGYRTAAEALEAYIHNNRRRSAIPLHIFAFSPLLGRLWDTPDRSAVINEHGWIWTVERPGFYAHMNYNDLRFVESVMSSSRPQSREWIARSLQDIARGISWRSSLTLPADGSCPQPARGDRQGTMGRPIDDIYYIVSFSRPENVMRHGFSTGPSGNHAGMATVSYGGQTLIVAHGRVEDAMRNFLQRTPIDSLVYPWQYYVYAFYCPNEVPLLLSTTFNQGPGAVARRSWPAAEVLDSAMMPHNLRYYIRNRLVPGLEAEAIVRLTAVISLLRLQPAARPTKVVLASLAVLAFLEEVLALLGVLALLEVLELMDMPPPDLLGLLELFNLRDRLNLFNTLLNLLSLLLLNLLLNRLSLLLLNHLNLIYPPELPSFSGVAQTGGPNVRADCASQLMRELRGLIESTRSQEAVAAFPTQVAEAACRPIVGMDTHISTAYIYQASNQSIRHCPASSMFLRYATTDSPSPGRRQRSKMLVRHSLRTREKKVPSLNSTLEGFLECDTGILPETISIDLESYAPEFEAIADRGDIPLDEDEGPCQDMPDQCDAQQSDASALSDFWIQWDLFRTQEDRSHADAIADLTGLVDLDAELCDRALSFPIFYDTHPRKRSLPSMKFSARSTDSSCCTLRRRLKMTKCGESTRERLLRECYSSGDQDCSEFQKKPVVARPICRFIDELHVDMRLSNDLWSGTTDTVKIGFNGGLNLTTLMEQPWRNDSISQKINLTDSFSADRVPLKAIQTIDLWGFTANESWYGMIRDPWKMEGAFSPVNGPLAKCADRFRRGLAIEMNSFKDVGDTIRRRTPDDKEKTWVRPVTVENWTMAGPKPKPKEEKPKEEKPNHKIVRDEFRKRRHGVFNATSA
ncbi:hypothetical protein L249_5096, partial [Ophiocordyceps polyrhachis-furcata BCC 54312]